MRQIKFKAYIKESKEIVDVAEINFKNKTIGVAIQGEGYLKIYNFNEIELLEYTEIKDDKGQELYKNDIVRCYGGEFCQGYWEYDGIYVIKKRSNNFDLINKNGYGRGWGFYDGDEYIIKIGNTYDNL